MTVYREPRRHLVLWRNSPVDCSSSFGRSSLLCICSVSDQLYSQQVVFWEVTAWLRAGAMGTRPPVGAGARRGSLGPLSRRRRAGTKPETPSLQQVGCVGSAQGGGKECRRAEEPRPPPAHSGRGAGARAVAGRAGAGRRRLRRRSRLPPQAEQLAPPQGPARAGQLRARASPARTAHARSAGACAVAEGDAERSPALGNARRFPCRPGRHFLSAPRARLLSRCPRSVLLGDGRVSGHRGARSERTAALCAAGRRWHLSRCRALAACRRASPRVWGARSFPPRDSWSLRPHAGWERSRTGLSLSVTQAPL